MSDTQKVLTFAIPCYNSAEYMDKCIQSLLDGSAEHLDQVEILIVDDGSTKDNTAQKADEWEASYPGIIRAIHQENAGHGGAVNKGLANAQGMYFKVIDSDDWIETDSGKAALELLCVFAKREDPIDMLLVNYVYAKVGEQPLVMDYNKMLPVGREFTWDEIGHFPPDRYILMHSVIYRTQVLRDCGLQLPEHTFYVDNIFVYVPLPHVKSAFYLDIDYYMYYIGREDQSVNEKVMAGRIEQQLKVTRLLIDAYDLENDIHCAKLRDYMFSYLRMMMTICSVFSLLSEREDKYELRAGIWDYLKQHSPSIYKKMRNGVFGVGTNLPGAAGTKVTLSLYHVAQRLFHFN